jgi:hypothetical protein
VAKTLTVGNALNVLAIRNPRLLSEGFGARFADEVQAYMWHRFPWRESLADLPPISLVPEEPFYGPPMLAVPADFHGLHDAWLRNMSGRVEPLLVQRGLRPSDGPGSPTSICYDARTGGFIVHPAPALTVPDWWIEGTYKKLPVKITADTVNSHVLPWDDLYFEVFRAGLKWKIAEELERSQDWPNLLAMFKGMVVEMAQNEGLIAGVEVVSPAYGLDYGD